MQQNKIECKENSILQIRQILWSKCQIDAYNTSYSENANSQKNSNRVQKEFQKNVKSMTKWFC